MTIDLNKIPIFKQDLQGNQASKSTLVATRITTPLGDLLAGATTQGICLLEYPEPDRLQRQLPRLEKISAATLEPGFSRYFLPLQQQLTEYFAGKRTVFDLPLDMQGTEFQKQSWVALQDIPYGETRSYQQQASVINQPKATRAVANANGSNKISIIIPCHRVVGKNGSITGYGGGVWRKEYLLALEQRGTSGASRKPS